MISAPFRGAGCFALAAAFFVAGARESVAQRASAGSTPPPPAHPPVTVRGAMHVVLFTPTASDPLVARIEAELAAVGIAVRRLPMPLDTQIDSVVTREIGEGASAAIRVIPKSRGAEVWTGETTARMLRRRSIRADTSDAALSVIALRTVEFLRASLLDVKRRGGGGGGSAAGTGRTAGDQLLARDAGGAGDKAPLDRAPATAAPAPGAASPDRPPPAQSPTLPIPAAAPPARPAEPPAARVVEPASPPPLAESRTKAKPADTPGREPRPEDQDESEPTERATPEPVPRQRRSASRHEITVGPSVVGSPGGTTPIASATAIGRVWFAGRVGAEAMALFPLVASRLTHAEGSMAVKAALFGGAVTLRLTGPGRWTADAAAGLCGQFFQVVGSGIGTAGDAPNQGGTESRWKLAGHARVGGGVEINHWLMMRADIVGGFAPSSRITLVYKVTDANQVDQVTTRATWGPAFVAGTVGLQADW
ncbi:MAG: hypothetical protein ABUL77_01655 [Bacteroidota bacterium]